MYKYIVTGDGMSYFIAVLIIAFLNFAVIIKSIKLQKNTAVFCGGKTGFKNIRKMNKLKSLGFVVFFAGKTNVENALKKGIMKGGECFVTEREFEMLTDAEKEKLISFCRYYLQCSDVRIMRDIVSRKYRVMDIEECDVLRLYGKSILGLIAEFVFLTEISLITAVITQKILTFLL